MRRLSVSDNPAVRALLKVDRFREVLWRRPRVKITVAPTGSLLLHDRPIALNLLNRAEVFAHPAWVGEYGADLLRPSASKISDATEMNVARTDPEDRITYPRSRRDRNRDASNRQAKPLS